jgi:acyl-CoA thioesterase-1
MSTIAIHFADGGALFTGSACLVVGVLAVTRGRHRFARPLGRMLVLFGLFAIVMSATPLPVWAYGIWTASLLLWIVSQTSTKFAGRRWRTGALAGCVGCTLLVVSWELNYQLPPRPLHRSWDRLIVIGDSLSAEDFKEGGDPWPKLLERGHGIRVENLAFSGAQTASAAKRVGSVDLSGALILLEIGGNDLLGAVSKGDFERGLERLLSLVCRDDNFVIMLELPLPPLYNGYGDVQRRLAKRHHVVLIPKRYFGGVFVGTAATIDSLHLSPAGHRKMADMVWQVVSPALSRSQL